MPRDISNNEDVLDSRDIIARIEELEGERDDFYTFCGCGTLAAPDPDCDKCGGSTQEPNPTAWAQHVPDDAAELAALSKLAEEAEQYADDWQHGETLIRDSYFTDYAQELCEDIGDIPKNLPPYIHIDWEATARNIQMDYTSVDFDGVTYWVR